METNGQRRRLGVNPYPGLASFGDSAADRTLFFGRDKESKSLFEMILAENLVLLFARSGVGKTSLINAAILEPLRARGFFPIVVRLTHDANRGPIQSVFECVAAQAIRDGVIVSDKTSTKSLWEYFYTTQFAKDGKLLRPVLVLDQFEELFTIIGSQKSRRESFVRELADLARQCVPEQVRKRETGNLEKLPASDTENPERQRIVSLLYEGAGPEVKIVISIREDFLAEIEGLKSELPTIFRNSFRLEPLSIDEARNAIEKPTQQKELLGDNRFTFAAGVVDRMLDFLRVQKVAGKFVRANSIEPVQLQILCQHFYRQSLRKRQRQPKAPGPAQEAQATIPEITVTDLGGRNGMKRAMVGYYYHVLEQFPRFRFGWSTRGYRPSLCNFLLINRARAAVRTLAENKLVTPGGYRNSISVDVIERGVGVPDRDLTKLVDERLLRTEPRLGSHFYELTHDTLIRPLVKARRKRRVYWAVSGALFLLILLYLPALSGSLYWRLKVDPLQYQASNATNKEERIAALRGLLNGEYQDCSGCNLASLDLHSFHISSANFSLANFSESDLHEAEINASNFSGAKMFRVNMDKADLRFSNFGEADLTEASFLKAKLQNTDFTKARLSGATMSGATLDDANFSGALIDGTDFKGARWWLATGWTTENISQLEKSWPHVLVKDTQEYKTDLAEKIAENPERSNALNATAWLRATCGVDLETAVSEARESLVREPGSERTMDTLGYILLQLGRYDEAEPLLRRSLEIRKLRQADPFRIGLAHYHLALALDRLGRYAEAQAHYDQAKSMDYLPSHECVMAPPTDPKNCSWTRPEK